MSRSGGAPPFRPFGSGVHSPSGPSRVSRPSSSNRTRGFPHPALGRVSHPGMRRRPEDESAGAGTRPAPQTPDQPEERFGPRVRTLCRRRRKWRVRSHDVGVHRPIGQRGRYPRRFSGPAIKLRGTRSWPNSTACCGAGCSNLSDASSFSESVALLAASELPGPPTLPRQDFHLQVAWRLFTALRIIQARRDLTDVDHFSGA